MVGIVVSLFAKESWQFAGVMRGDSVRDQRAGAMFAKQWVLVDNTRAANE